MPAKYLRKCVDQLILVAQNSSWSLDQLLKKKVAHLIPFWSRSQTLLQATCMWLPLPKVRVRQQWSWRWVWITGTMTAMYSLHGHWIVCGTWPYYKTGRGLYALEHFFALTIQFTPYAAYLFTAVLSLAASSCLQSTYLWPICTGNNYTWLPNFGIGMETEWTEWKWRKWEEKRK